MLITQGLNIGRRAAEFAQGVFPGKKIHLIPTSTEQQLRSDLAATLEKYGRFRSILIVGHSNIYGLQLTDERFCKWDGVARWVEIFNPEFILLAACEAWPIPSRSRSISNDRLAKTSLCFPSSTLP